MGLSSLRSGLKSNIDNHVSVVTELKVELTSNNVDMDLWVLACRQFLDVTSMNRNGLAWKAGSSSIRISDVFILRNAESGLIEETTEALITRLLSLGLLLLLLGGSGRRGIGGSGDSRGSILLRVGDTLLQLLNLGPAVLSGDGNRQNILVAVDNGVHDGRKGWEVDGKRDASDGGDGAGESLEELLLANVEDVGREGVAVVVNLRNAHSVGERRDVKHVQEGSLGSSDLGTGLNELEISGNFDRTTGNLGWDTKSLEERGLSGLHAGVTSRDVDIIWCNGASSGWGGNLVGKDLVADLLQVTVGEDESDVALDEWKKALPLWGVTHEPLDGTANL